MVLDAIRKLKDRAAKDFKKLDNLKPPPDSNRQDASRQDVIYRFQVVGGPYDKADPFDFVPSLVLYKKNDINNKDHRIAVAQHDPRAKFAVYSIADAAFDKYPQFTNEKGEPIDEMNDLVLPRLQELHTLEKVKYACYGERIHGWSLVVLMEGTYLLPEEEDAAAYKDFFENLQTPSYGEPDKIEAFHGEAEVIVDEFDEHPDRLGKPKYYKITLEVPSGKGQTLKRQFIVHHSRTILDNPRPVGRSHKGLSALAPAWDGLVLLRNIEYSMAFYDIKFGGGFFSIGPKEGHLSDTDKQQAQNVLKEAHTRQGVVTPIPVEIERHGGAGTVSYEAHMDAVLGVSIAPGLQIPKDILKGVSAGTLTGSEVNLRELYTTINAVQKSYEQVLRKLIKRLFPTKDFGEYYFDWPLEFTLDEKERVEVDKTKSETLATATAWKTINEIRADEGLKPLPEGGDIVLSLQQQLFKFTTEPAEPTTRKEEIIQEASMLYNRDFKNFSQVADFMKRTEGGVMKCCQKLGMSSQTWYEYLRKEENGE